MRPNTRPFPPVLMPLALGLLTCTMLGPAPLAHAQGPLLTPQQAGREAYWYFESQRQTNVQRQLGLIDTMRWLNGLPNRYTGLRNSPSLAAIYSGATEGLVPGGYVFEPWPYVPGDIYGFQWDDLGSQPVGNDIVFDGPNRYSYRNTYSSQPVATPPVAAPQNVPPPPVAAMPFDPDPAAIAARERKVAVPAEMAGAGPGGPVVEGALAAAGRAFRSGRVAEALKMLEAVPAESPRRPQADLLRSHVLFAMGRFNEAATVLRQAVAKLPPEAYSATLQGLERDYPNPEAYTGRLRQLERTITESPPEPSLRLLLGYHYGYLGFLPEAVTELSQALQLNPDDAAAGALQRHYVQMLEGPAAAAPAAPPLGQEPAAPHPQRQPGHDGNAAPAAPPDAAPPAVGPPQGAPPRVRRAEAAEGRRSF